MVSIVGVQVGPTDYAKVVRQVLHWARLGKSCYVCFVNVHMLMEANDLPAFAEIVRGADIAAPDGMPLVWMMRLKGQKNQQRVYGPTLMLYLLESAAKEKIPVGYYGGAPEVLETLVVRMKERFPGLNVVYSYSPPFRELSEQENKEMIQSINKSGAQILFVGLGCPKQEIWMAEHRGKIASVMLGVGAAFDFHAGVKPQAPGWIQILGLEWLFRLATEPRRLWRRYLYYNLRFIFLGLLDLIHYLMSSL